MPSLIISMKNIYNDNLIKFQKVLKSKNIDSYLYKISNENLYEFVNPDENLMLHLTGFTGDTALLLIKQNVSILIVDGRFTIQAKNEVLNRKIKIVETNSNNSYIDIIKEYIKNNEALMLNDKLFSYNFLNEIKNSINIKYDNQNILINSLKIETSKNDNIYLLEEKYIDFYSKIKIKNILTKLSENNNIKLDDDLFYISTDLNEINYITNLYSNKYDNITFKSFLIINIKNSYLYIDTTCEFIKSNSFYKISNYLKKNNIILKNIDEFYSDIAKIKGKIILNKNSNHFIVKKFENNKNAILLDGNDNSLNDIITIKNKKIVNNIKKANAFESINFIYNWYNIKQNLKTKKLSEYDIKNIVDNKIFFKDKYICNSFNTIVAYKENSAICHYKPKINNSKIVNNNSILLIDTGSHYKLGTTDITRTISLYNDSRKVSKDIKKYYTLVLKCLLNLTEQKFLNNTTGKDLNILTRKYLLNEKIDFKHGSGHGIGFLCSVHYGKNSFSTSIINNYILKENQLQSIEPGIYFENKFGIRIENDILTKECTKNIFGKYLCFENITYIPYDIDLIDKNLLDDKEIRMINEYHNSIYKKFYKYFNKNQKLLEFFKYITRKIV